MFNIIFQTVTLFLTDCQGRAVGYAELQTIDAQLAMIAHMSKWHCAAG